MKTSYAHSPLCLHSAVQVRTENPWEANLFYVPANMYYYSQVGVFCAGGRGRGHMQPTPVAFRTHVVISFCLPRHVELTPWSCITCAWAPVLLCCDPPPRPWRAHDLCRVAQNTGDPTGHLLRTMIHIRGTHPELYNRNHGKVSY